MWTGSLKNCVSSELSLTWQRKYPPPAPPQIGDESILSYFPVKYHALPIFRHHPPHLVQFVQMHNPLLPSCSQFSVQNTLDVISILCSMPHSSSSGSTLNQHLLAFPCSNPLPPSCLSSSINTYTEVTQAAASPINDAYINWLLSKKNLASGVHVHWRTI